MDRKELFSVVIPAYNRERTVGRSIKSVLNQTYQKLQVVIVDDGSKDGTKDAVSEYLSDNRVAYVYQENGGAQKARNTGLRRAEGEYILFLDSDDELLPQCLEKMVQLYNCDDTVGAVYCLAGVRKKGQLKPMRKDHLQGNIFKEVLEQGYLTSSSFISMRRAVFDVIGEWDITFPASQDDDICFRIAKKYKIGFLNEILGIYYFDAGKGMQISSSPVRVANGWWLLWNKYEEDVVRECGISTARKHFTKCAYRYKKCGESGKYKLCCEKVKKYSNKIEYYTSVVKIYCMIVRDCIKRMALYALNRR